MLSDTTPWETSSTAKDDLFSDMTSGKFILTVCFHLRVMLFSPTEMCVLAQMLFSGALLLFSLEIWLELCEFSASHGSVRIGKEQD